MKLIFCPNCEDVVRLFISTKPRKCKCKKSWGHYTDSINAVIGGIAIPMGFANSSLVEALINRPEFGWGSKFEAFIIPNHSNHINYGEKT
jgi:hypothetical protein